MAAALAIRSAGVAWTAYAVSIAGTSLLASALRSEGSSTSLWWPAAGVGVAGALLLPARHLWRAVATVAVVTAVVNVVTDRPPAVAVLFGVANAAEVAVAVRLLGGARPALSGLADVARLLRAAVAGAVTAAAGAALTVQLLVDGGGGLATLRSVSTSHLSAVLLIVPLVLRHRRVQQEAGRAETVLAWLLLAVLLGAIFAPDQDLPVAFLPLVALTWAGVRLPGTTAVAQVTASGLYVTAATLAGWGPFAHEPLVADDPFVTINLVQTYILVSAAVALTLVALVEERRLALAELRALSLRDALTGLPNRRLLFDRLRQAAGAVRHDGGAFTVLVVDLDGFKAVNDRAGHAAGDELLVTTAHRLEAVVRPGDTVARLGGDEFAVVCPGLGSGPAVDELVRRVDSALRRPVLTASGSHAVRASIGVAHGTGTSDVTAVLRDADRAMYAQKHERHGEQTGVVLPHPRSTADELTTDEPTTDEPTTDEPTTEAPAT